jgi:outer membrane biosynthesis protein TonB
VRLERQPPRRQARGIPARPTSPPPPSEQAPPDDEETTPAEQPIQAEDSTPAGVPTPAADSTPAEVPTPAPPPPTVSATASEPAPPPAERRPLWRRALRVNLVLAGAAVVLLLVGYLAGATVTRDGTSTPPQSAAPPSPTATSIVPAPPPRACVVAVEQADIAISYLVGNIRDQRLSRAIQEFVRSRRACQQAMR